MRDTPRSQASREALNVKKNQSMIDQLSSEKH